MADYNTDRRLENVKKICTEFKQLKKSATKEHIANLWHDVHDTALKKTQIRHDERCLKEVVITLCDTITDETLECPTEIVLEKWLVLRNCFGHLLRMWPKFNIDVDAFNSITNRFSLIPKTKWITITKENIQTIKLVLLDEYFVNGIIKLIRDIMKMEQENVENSSKNNKNGDIYIADSGNNRIVY